MSIVHRLTNSQNIFWKVNDILLHYTTTSVLKTPSVIEIKLHFTVTQIIWAKCKNTHFTHPRDVPFPVRYSAWQTHNIHLYSTEEYNHTIYETLMLLNSRRHLENYATHTRHSHLSNTRTNVCCQKHYETRTTITNGCTTPTACDWTYGKHHDLSNPASTNNVPLPVSKHLA